MTTQRDQRIIEGEAELAETLKPLEGQWIAVCAFRVLDHADTLDELLQRVDCDAVDRIFEVAPLAPVRRLPSHG